MRTTYNIVFCFLLGCAFFSRAQVVSKFTWDTNPITTAITGPNAISAGSTATSSTGGVGGTNGLNPGAPSPATDIDLTIPNTGSVLDVSNIDISIDYRRNESTAQMIKRGTFTFNNGGGSANFQVVFRVNNGSGGTTVTSTAVAIPQDATFRTYRFTYDNCSGVGTMYVNGVVVWASPTPTVNQNLYWVSDGNMVIGQDMDGANDNVPNLDNFIMQGYTCSTLPIELLNFIGNNEGNRNYLKWSTATEKNNDFFTVERSLDGMNWSTVCKVYSQGNFPGNKSYSAYDNSPARGINYYRLMQTDFDGHTEKFSIVSIDNSYPAEKAILKTVDLLGREVSDNYTGLRFIIYSNGQVIKKVGE